MTVGLTGGEVDFLGDEGAPLLEAGADADGDVEGCEHEDKEARGEGQAEEVASYASDVGD